MKLKTSRVETLVDGVFAIAMTVLILNFSEVLSLTAPQNEQDFHSLFLTLGNNFFAYVISFFLLGVFWLEHHRQSHFIKQADSVSIFLNLFWLMFVSLIPFSTLMLGNHENFVYPVCVFEINILIVNVLFYALWVYVTRNHRLVDSKLDKKAIALNGQLLRLCILFSLLALSLSVIHPLISLIVLIIVPLVVIFKGGGLSDQ